MRGSVRSGSLRASYSTEQRARPHLVDDLVAVLVSARTKLDCVDPAQWFISAFRPSKRLSILFSVADTGHSYDRAKSRPSCRQRRQCSEQAHKEEHREAASILKHDVTCEVGDYSMRNNITGRLRES